MDREKITVLHVDDDEAFWQLTETFLGRLAEEFDVVPASSGRAGLGALEDHDVDCVVSDYDMPGMDGLALLGSVREDHPDLPFVLFTGKGSEEIASDAITAGVSDYIQKRGNSGQYELLANRVRNLTVKYHAEQRARRVFETIDVLEQGISLLDPDGTIQYVNRSYADIFGYRRSELVGAHCSVLYPSRKDFERVQAEVEPELSEDARWRGRTVNVRADGSTLRTAHSLSLTSDGTVVCLMKDDSQGAEDGTRNGDRAPRRDDAPDDTEPPAG